MVPLLRGERPRAPPPPSSPSSTAKRRGRRQGRGGEPLSSPRRAEARRSLEAYAGRRGVSFSRAGSCRWDAGNDGPSPNPPARGGGPGRLTLFGRVTGAGQAHRPDELQGFAPPSGGARDELAGDEARLSLWGRRRGVRPVKIGDERRLRFRPPGERDPNETGGCTSSRARGSKLRKLRGTDETAAGEGGATGTRLRPARGRKPGLTRLLRADGARSQATQSRGSFAEAGGI